MFEKIKQTIIDRYETKQNIIIGELEEIYYNTMLEIIKEDENSAIWLEKLKDKNSDDRKLFQEIIKKLFDEKMIDLDDKITYKNLGTKWTLLGAGIVTAGLAMDSEPVMLAGIGVVCVACMRAAMYFTELNRDGEKSRLCEYYRRLSKDSEAMTNLTTCCLDRYMREEVNVQEGAITRCI